MHTKKVGEAMSSSTLRPGDVITGFGCDECADTKVLVLKKHENGAFDLSFRASRIYLAKDVCSPYTWEAPYFIDQDGRPHDHIRPDSTVMVAAGVEELGWYQSLPQPSDAPFQLADWKTLGAQRNNKKIAQLEALLAGAMYPPEPEVRMQNMQLAVGLALEGVKLEGPQMRLIVELICAYGVACSKQSSGSGGVDALMASIFASSLGGSDRGIVDVLIASSFLGTRTRRPR
ncbi:MAG: hypothetical protein JWN37_861 [Candidatus Nomurabacteria bacterium]|nr:hypothetical protein [Candidatus Nomurabacteria bacterium]